MNLGGRRDSRRIYAAPSTYWQRLIPALAPVVGFIAPVESCRALKQKGPLSLSALLRATRSGPSLRARVRRVG